MQDRLGCTWPFLWGLMFLITYVSLFTARLVNIEFDIRQQVYVSAIQSACVTLALWILAHGNLPTRPA